MKIRIIIWAALSAVLLCSIADAQTQRSLIGTWKGTSHAAVIGDANHHGEANDSEPRFLRTELTLVIEKDDGRNFSGYVISETHKELIVGAFGADLVNGVYVDTDGTAIIRRISEDFIQACYAHTPATGNGTAVAACLDYEREF